MASDLLLNGSRMDFLLSLAFSKIENLQRKAILIIDNMPTHPSNLRNGDIVIKGLSPNLTSLVRTLDHDGVMECFNYYWLLLRSLPMKRRLFQKF